MSMMFPPLARYPYSEPQCTHIQLKSFLYTTFLPLTSHRWEMIPGPVQNLSTTCSAGNLTLVMFLVFSPKISPFKIYQILGGNWFFRPLPNALFPSVRSSMICSQVFMNSESTVHAHLTHNYGTQARNFFELVHKSTHKRNNVLWTRYTSTYTKVPTRERTRYTSTYAKVPTREKRKRKEKRSLNSVHKYVHKSTHKRKNSVHKSMYTKVPTRETFFELGINDSLSVELVWWKELLKELQLSLDEGTSFHLQHLQRAPPTWLNRN